MTPRRIAALLRLELRGSLPVLLGWVLGYGALLALFVSQDNGPYPILIWVWCMGGLLIGSGLLARDRRLRTAPWLGSLPVSARAAGISRYLLRLLILGGIFGGILLLQTLLELLLGMQQEILQSSDIPPAALMAAAGFGLAAMAGAVANRETLALGGGFLALTAAMGLFMGILVIHPHLEILWSTIIPTLRVCALGSLLLGGWAVARSRHLTDLHTRRGKLRAFLPLLAGLLVGGILLAAWPYWLLRLPLDRMDHLTGLRSIPGTREVLIEGNRTTSNTQTPLGLWRVSAEKVVKLVPPRFSHVSPSPDGRLLAVHRPERWIWKRTNRVDLLDRQGSPVRRAERKGWLWFEGSWSPDASHYAYNSAQNTGNKLVLLPADPAHPAVAWGPPDATLSSRHRIVPAGWASSDRIICLDTPLQETPESQRRLWSIEIDGSARQLWEGPAVPFQYLRSSTRLLASRGSILLKEKASPEDPETVRLLELPLDGGPAVDRGLIPLWTDLSTDVANRSLLWTDQHEYEGSIRSMLYEMDLEAGWTRSRRVPHLQEVRISPDGRFVAGLQMTPGEAQVGELWLLERATDRVATGPGSVRAHVWLPDAHLGLLLADETLVRLDAETGRILPYPLAEEEGGAR